jgi:hypothetical protein
MGEEEQVLVKHAEQPMDVVADVISELHEVGRQMVNIREPQEVSTLQLLLKSVSSLNFNGDTFYSGQISNFTVQAMGKALSRLSRAIKTPGSQQYIARSVVPISETNFCLEIHINIRESDSGFVLKSIRFVTQEVVVVSEVPEA